jgi:hypothetical protein
VIVDAPNTAYALQLYELLARAGLKKGDYEVKVVGATFRRAEAIRSDKTIAASMLNPPFSNARRKPGLKSMGSAVKRSAVSGDRRFRDARLGEGERGHAGQIPAGLYRGRALVARSAEQARRSAC